MSAAAINLWQQAPSTGIFNKTQARLVRTLVRNVMRRERGDVPEFLFRPPRWLGGRAGG